MINPTRRSLALAAALIFAALAPAAAQMDALMQQAQASFNANNPRGAISPLSQGLSIAQSRGNQQAIADFSQYLGIAYDNDSQPDLALQYYNQALSVYRTLGDKPDAASTMGNIGIVYKNKGDNAKALEIETQALAIARETNDKIIEGRTVGNLANVYSQMGDHLKALEYNNLALTIQSGLGDKSGVTIDLQNIAAEYQSMGDYPKALDYAGRALQSAQSSGDKIAEAGVDSIYGNIYLETGDFPKAIDYDRRAISIFHNENDKRDEASVLGNLGLVYAEQTDLPQALALYDQSLALSREMGDKTMQGKTLGNVGVSYMTMGDFPKALDHMNRGLALQTETGDKGGQGAGTNNLADLYNRLGDSAKALETDLRALKLLEEASDKNGQAITLNHIGELYQAQDDYAKALEYHARSLAISKAIGVPTKGIEADMGGAYLALGNLAGAAELAERAKDDVLSGEVALAKGQYEPARALFAKAALEGKAHRTADDVVSANLGLCRTLEKLKNLAGARAACDEAVAVIERQRDLLPQSARGRFLTARVAGTPRIEAYKTRARVQSDAADGFYWAESAKARAFIEEVAARLGASKAALPSDLAAKESELNARVAGVYKQMDAAFEKKNAPRLAELEGELPPALAARDAFVAELRKTRPEYAAIQYPVPIKAAEVGLNADEALIEYEVTDSKTLIFVVGADKKASSFAAEIPRAELRKLVEAFRKPFENPLDAQGKFAAKFDAAAGAKLYGLLLRPAAAAVKGKKLIVVPDEFLGLLPFEALVSRPAQPKSPKGPATPVRYAADEHDMAYAQSATALTLARARTRDAAPGGLLAVADPIFDKSDARVKGSALASYVAKDFVAMGVAATRRGSGFDRLEETGALASTLKAAFGDGAVALTGKDASKTKVLAEDLGRYRHIVFATHGILDGDVPYIGEPALVLNQIGNADGDDGFLKMSEVMGLKLSADVVALTACKTGIGREVGGEGVMGLGRAFQYAGAKNVLVSLWSVSEKSTTELGEAFFKALKDGKTPREALRTARAQLRKGAYGAPFFWAPFILIGG